MGKMIKKVNDNLDWENAEGYEQLGVNFFQVGNPNTVKPFTGPGEEKLFNHTKTFPEIIECNWRYFTQKIEYRWNSEGFRNDFEFDDVDWKNSMAVIGCSHVFGKGVGSNETLVHYLNKETGMKAVNIGSEGASIRTVFNNAIHLLSRYYPKAIAVLWPRVNRHSLTYKWDTVINEWSSIDMSGTEETIDLFRPMPPDQWGLIHNEKIALTYRDLWPRLDESNFIENQDTVYQLNLYKETLKIIARDRGIEYYDYSLGRINKPGKNALDQVDADYPEHMQENFRYTGDFPNRRPGFQRLPREHKHWWINNVCARDIVEFHPFPGGCHFGPVIHEALARLMLKNRLV